MENDLNSTKIIELSDCSVFFDKKDVGIERVNLEINAGEFVCVVGLSGSGKSTLLKLIAGLEKPSAGSIKVPGNISMVFQTGALFPWLTVFDNVALALEVLHKSKNYIKEEANKYIKMMGLENFIDKYPRELSGGQRQRVGIARALAVNPSVLLLDEPFSALDVKTTEELHKDLLKIWGESKKTVIMVSHSIEEAVTLAEKIILVKDHKIHKVWPVNVPRPRREQEASFMHEVQLIRKEFF